MAGKNRTLGNLKNLASHQLFEAQVEQTPDAIAVVFEEEQLTYRELNDRANKIAHYLRAMGVGTEVLVGLCVERSLAMVVGLLGILKAGGAYVPLDPMYPKERLAFMLEDTQMPVLLTQQRLVPLLPVRGAKVVCLDANREAITKQSQENPVSGVTPGNLAYVIYTSGSTGKPKGVLVEHRSLCNLAKAQLKSFDVQADSRVLQFASLSFDASVSEVFMTLMAGATLVLSTRDFLLPGPALIQLLRDQVITHITLSPSVLAVLPVEELTALQTIIVMGEACPSKLVTLWAPDRRFFNAYGPTEATVCTTITKCTYCDKKLPIGYPIANTQVYLLDAQLQSVSIGVPGEIYIGGVGLARGYLNQPQLTAEKFIPNPYSDESGARLYKTGDLARYLPDGPIEFLGRIDQQVKIRGFRVEVGEIEAVLNQHPEVRQIVVMAREDLPGNKRLVAYVVPAQGCVRSIESNYEDPNKIELWSSVAVEISRNNPPKQLAKPLRTYLKEYLPDYMLPSAFVLLETLPLLPNGKVDRRALPAPDMAMPALEGSFVAPRTPVEEKIAEVWARVIGIEKVGIHDNFLDLGGNSLLAAQLIMRLQEAFEIELPVRCLYESPTVMGLAQIIDVMQGDNSSAFLASTTTDLKAEAMLDPEIRPRGTPVEKLSEPRHIFLTGATGFLGAFLLHELLQQTQAEIYCLVRSPNEREGLKRLQRTLEKYSLWNPRLGSKIIPLTGDLTQPLLGLSREKFERLAFQLDAIYHSGADVNFVKPYSLLKATNVLGTQEVLRLASQGKAKPMHYISTVAVFGHIGYFTSLKVIREEEDLDSSERYLYMGYSQSKWVAEKFVWIAKSRGMPISIFRPGFIMGHSRTGISNVNDLPARLIKGCIQMGSFPALVDQNKEFIPVDFASRAIVHISSNKEFLGKAFHLVPPYPIQFIELFELICSYGYPLKKLPYTKWKDKLIHQIRQSQDNALLPLLPLHAEKVHQQTFTQPELSQKTPYFDCQNTHNSLTGTSITCPPMNAELLDTYFSYFIRSGFLDPP